MDMLSIKKLAFGLALTTTVFGAKAQKVYTEGSINYTITVKGNSVDAVSYFKGDTSSIGFQQGPAQIKMVGTKQSDYFAVMVDVPVANMKKAAIATPAEADEAQSMEPQYAFTKTAEAKKIDDYNCIKYVAKDVKSGISYDLWITSDIKVPANILTKFYADLGTPIQFTYLQGGTDKGAQTVLLKSISDAKVPANTFKVTSDYDKMSLTDLQAMGKGRQ